jgi:purine-nucleoside phosphorylase
LQYHSGALVIGHSVSDGKNTIDINSPWLQELGKLISKEKTLSIHEAAFLSTSLPLRTKNEKISHNPDEEWDAVEMESYGIAEIAKERDIPVLIIRAIVDELNTIIPKGTENMIDVNGRQKFSTTFLELIKTPSDLKRYLKLAKAKSKADKTLRRVATIIAESRFT